MNRISIQTIESTSYQIFRGIEIYEIVEEDYPRALPLKVETKFEKIVVKEFEEFINQLALMPIDFCDETPEIEESYESIKRIMADQLAAVDSIKEETYLQQVMDFFKLVGGDSFSPFIEEVIEKARKYRESSLKFTDNMEKFSEKIGQMIEEVVAIYEEANGEPEPKPMINCPICEGETNNYACAYSINNHVHFICEHCGTNMRQ